MSDFSGMEDLLQDFLQEASDLLSDVDNKLVDLEKDPGDRRLLNDIFRGFHTIKGGAGFLNATELVTLCHLTENLFDKLRNAEMGLTPELMDTIMAATQGVRSMFGELGQAMQPRPAPEGVIHALRVALQEKSAAPAAEPEPVADAAAAPAPSPQAEPPAATGMIIANPPYGEQSAPRSATVPKMMGEIGDRLKAAFPGWRDTPVRRRCEPMT